MSILWGKVHHLFDTALQPFRTLGFEVNNALFDDSDYPEDPRIHVVITWNTDTLFERTYRQNERGVVPIHSAEEIMGFVLSKFSDLEYARDPK